MAPRKQNLSRAWQLPSKGRERNPRKLRGFLQLPRPKSKNRAQREYTRGSPHSPPPLKHMCATSPRPHPHAGNTLQAPDEPSPGRTGPCGSSPLRVGGPCGSSPPTIFDSPRTSVYFNFSTVVGRYSNNTTIGVLQSAQVYAAEPPKSDTYAPCNRTTQRRTL